MSTRAFDDWKGEHYREPGTRHCVYLSTAERLVTLSFASQNTTLLFASFLLFLVGSREPRVLLRLLLSEGKSNVWGIITFILKTTYEDAAVFSCESVFLDESNISIILAFENTQSRSGT